MKKLALLVLLIPVVASAQSIVVGQQAIGWDQAAASVGEAQGLTYKLYVDAAPGLTLPSVTCSGPVSPYACKSNLPPLTSGTHDLTLTASLAGQETLKAVPLKIQVVIVAVPQNLRIVTP